MSAYYNEFDPFAAQWLRNLIEAGHIASGDVDERSIRDVTAADLTGYGQCHFFAGIGVWSYALRCAGWPDDREVWTGSCPCQPFSAAGKQGGFDDERHLWPEFFRLIGERRPHVVFGEQVASRDGLAWLDAVSVDMEGAGYTFGAVDTCAAGFGAPHIRQRLYFVGDSSRSRHEGDGLPPVQRGGDSPGAVMCVAGSGTTNILADSLPAGRPEGWTVAGSGQTTGCGGAGELAYAEHDGLHRQAGYEAEQGRDGEDDGLPLGSDSRIRGSRAATNGFWADATGLAGWCGTQDGGLLVNAESEQMGIPRRSRQPRSTNGFWADADWLPCQDGKSRPVEPGTSPLAHGIANRVGRLRAYGNALNAEQAKAFVTAYMEVPS